MPVDEFHKYYSVTLTEYRKQLIIFSICLAQNGMEHGSDVKIIGNSYSLAILKIHLDFFNIFYSQCTCTLIVEYLLVKNTLNNGQFTA